MSKYDLYLNFDGGCWPNPSGLATWGFAIKNRRNETVMEASGSIGSGPHVSNNVAEYAAILQALRAVEDMAARGWRVLIRGNSDLDIRQMAGVPPRANTGR
jgi:ribonuclease HI